MKTKYTSIVLASALTLSSCSLDRYPLNGPSSGTFPASESEALAGTLAAYKGLGNMSAQNCYFPYNNEDCATDIFSYRAGASNFQLQLNSSMTSDMSLVEKEYRAVFKVAGRCHQVLDKLDNLKDKCSEETIAQFKAELLCIRAQQYDQAMQFYGGIPFIDHSLDLEDYSYPRSSVKECTERILNEDLSDENLDALPIAWDSSTYGTTRVGRACAYALKARIALNWGYVDIAKEAAAKAIDLCEGVYSLEVLDIPDEAYIPHDQGEIDVTNLFGFDGESSREWLWAIQRSKTVGPDMMQTIYYSSPRTLSGCSWFGPTQSLVDTYQCKDGLSILESPLYDPTNPWVNRDPRLNITACLPGTRKMGVEYEMDCTIAEVANYNSLDAIGNPTTLANADAYPKVNKYEYAANNTKGPGGFYCSKFYDITYVLDGSITDREDQLNTGLIRYAELLLVDAEANIESENGDLARAKREIDMIRERVKMPTLKVSDRDGLRSALRYERKVELAGEGFRWFDIRRWAQDGGLCYTNGELNGKASVASVLMNGPQWCMGYSTTANPKNYISNAKPTIDANWSVMYDGNTTWKSGELYNLRKFDVEMVYNDAKDRLWPFPAKEINTNPMMDAATDQNPGYSTAK